MSTGNADALFSQQERAGLEDFWTVYEGSFDMITEAATLAVMQRPVLAALMAQTTEEQRAAQSKEGRARLRRAIDGGWQDFEQHLRTEGATYAALGLDYLEWCILMRVVSRICTPMMIERYCNDPARLCRALSSMQAYFDWSLAILADSYLEAKHKALVASEKQRVDDELVAREAQARSHQLEMDNDRINEANRLKSEFLANMSHELRTPLNAIIGFAEILYEGEVTPDMPEHKEFLGDILTSGRHLLGLINDVLDLAKVESGKLVLHPSPTNLQTVVAEVTAILRATAAATRAQISVDVDPSLGDLLIDTSRLKQVLYNYLSNALKFTGAGGTVSVRARAEGSAFRIEVTDTGKGIAPEDLPRLFKEFQQLEASATKEHAGTGLGLALTRRLVEAQGGAVGVTSELGRGSTFFVVLPQRAASAASMPSPRSFPSANSASMTILVVEDDERDQELIVKTLLDAGYAVETAATAAQALLRCKERVFHGITLDLLLPDASGLDVLRALRADESTRAVPVFVLTVVAEKGAVAGFTVNDILGKPLEAQVLLDCLARAGLRPASDDDVLVVDDDPGSLKLMSVALAQLGYDGQCVERAQDALDLAERRPPRAVVLDLLMPEMDGFEFLKRFRTLPGCGAVPVVVWTTKDLTIEEVRQLHASAQAVVHKGSRSAILEELRAFLPQAQLRADASAAQLPADASAARSP